MPAATSPEIEFANLLEAARNGQGVRARYAAAVKAENLAIVHHLPRLEKKANIVKCLNYDGDPDYIAERKEREMGRKKRSTGRKKAEAKTPSAVKKTARRKSDGRDPRLPKAGTELTAHYKGKTFKTKVEADGFSFQGKAFSSLSGVGKAATGKVQNGFRFFGLC